MLPAASTAATYKVFVPHWLTVTGQDVAVLVADGLADVLVLGFPVGFTAATALAVTPPPGQVVVTWVTPADDSGWFSEYSNSYTPLARQVEGVPLVLAPAIGTEEVHPDGAGSAAENANVPDAPGAVCVVPVEEPATGNAVLVTARPSGAP